MAYELQKEEAEIDQKIAGELIALTPEWWNAVVLEVKHSVQAQNTSLNITVKSPEGYSDAVEPSPEIYTLVLDLYDLFKRYDHPWQKATYTVTLQPDKEWRFEAGFEY